MSLKLRQIKKGMLKGGKTKPAKYTPPRFLWRDANAYAELPIVPKTLDLVPKKLKKDVSDLDFIGVIKSEFPTRKKPKGSKSKDVGPSYRTTIKFEDVKFSETKDKIHTEEIEFKGKKLYFKKPSLAKNSAKIRCQCFTGETLIPLVDGTSKSIESLVGKEFYVYSFNEKTKKMEVSKASNCEAKREDVIYNVKLDNWHTINCTGDHKFLTRSGEWVEAKDLKMGDSLEPLYRKESTKKDDHKRVGYEMVYQTHFNGYEFTHVLSDECNLRDGTQIVKQGDTRHHVDFNKLNNDPTNILRLPWLDHAKLHHVHMAGDNNPMKNPETVAKCVATSRANRSYSKMNNNFNQSSPEVRRKMSDAKKGKISPNFKKCQDVNSKLIESGNHNFQSGEHTEFARKRALNGGLSKNNKNTIKRKKLVNWLGELKNGSVELTKDLILNTLNYSQYFHGLNAIRNYITNSDIFSFDFETKTLTKNDDQYNHKVVSVTKTDKIEMTYCFTVEGNHNFSIDVGDNSGVVVKNCADFRHKFETPIARAGALAFGTARPYIRKTPEWTLGNIKKWEDDKTGEVKKPYPYANPTDKLGYCKHIHSFLAYLMDDAKLVKQA